MQNLVKKNAHIENLKLEHIAHETMKNVISDHPIVCVLFLWLVNYISRLLLSCLLNSVPINFTLRRNYIHLYCSNIYVRLSCKIFLLSGTTWSEITLFTLITIRDMVCYSNIYSMWAVICTLSDISC